MLAETWIEAAAAREGVIRGRVRLISAAAQAADGAPLPKAPWLKPRTLSELLKATPASWSQKFNYSDAAREAQLAARRRAIDGSSGVVHVRADVARGIDVHVDIADQQPGLVADHRGPLRDAHVGDRAERDVERSTSR